MTSLDGWENYYVIIGSSAAALTVRDRKTQSGQ